MPKRKAKKSKGDKAKGQKHRTLIESVPQLTILSDHPLEIEDLDDDCFLLSYHIGPIYDIIRHPKTKLPMSIAIYGTWGAGKSSAMRWLHGLIDGWNEWLTLENKDAIRVHPVWFYPWKYQEREDVWRGLIAKIIAECVIIKKANKQGIMDMLGEFGDFVGDLLFQGMKGLKFRTGISASGVKAEAEYDFSIIEGIENEFERKAHPEKPYLNEFEHVLEALIKKTLGDNDRMVIFIDDLDRCMPEVALQVLEALKLYLSIPKLIFVVGVDREVIDELVKKHYEKLGLKKEKSGKYLAKMFQVEVNLNPSEDMIEQYMDRQLDGFEVLQSLETDVRHVFRNLLHVLAGRNPREINRLVNNVLITGVGFTKLGSDYRFEQGLQVSLIKHILEKRFPDKAWLIGSRLGDRFFGEWSRIVKENIHLDIPRSFNMANYIADLETMDFTEFGTFPSGDPRSLEHARVLETDLSFAPEQFHELLKDISLSYAFELFADHDLGELMRIEYPRDTEAIRQAVGRTPDKQIIREAIASDIGKDISNLTAKDYQGISGLDLSGSGISNIEFIKELTNLTRLSLSNTHVSDLEPLRNLTNLSVLSLTNTHVSDLEPLKSLTKLTNILLFNTQVSDLEPLSNLTNLSVLYLSGSQVSDLEPLQALTNLSRLNLSNTQVSDLEPLRELTNLSRLNLPDTQVSDLEPLRELTNLTELWLYNTQVNDLEPLKVLTNLSELYLSGTQVSDIEPLKALTNLSELYLSNVQVSDIEPLKALTNLSELYLSNSQVSDIEPLKALTNLSELSLSDTQVSDIGSLRNLTNLSVLYLRNTQVSEEQIKSLKETLPRITVHR